MMTDTQAIDFALASARMAHDQRAASDDAAADYFDNLRTTLADERVSSIGVTLAEEAYKTECIRLGLRSLYLGI